jgi:hypothetical protein
MKETSVIEFPASQSITSESMTAFLLSKTDDVTGLLNNFYYTARGKVSNLKIDPDGITLAREKTGTVIARFQVNYSNGCQDLSYNEDTSMRMSFEIDIQNQLFILSSEEVRERDPDLF